MSEVELGGLLSSFSRSARRFEVRERYNSEVGREPLRRFLAGEPDDFAWHRDWMEMVERDRRAGKTWQRIRIVSVPPSDYTRYGLAVARHSVRAGEDIRYLRRDLAAQLEVEPYDAWLLDDQTLVRLDFNDEDDTFVGAQIVHDPETVDRHRAWWPVAWQLAEPIDAFVAAYP
jgi:hypothetical protein